MHDLRNYVGWHDPAGDAGEGESTLGGDYFDVNDHFQAFLATEKNGHWGASASSCAVGGSYMNSADHGELFLISLSKGHWGQAREMPGLASINKGSTSQIYAMSCSSAGNCSAVGYYENSGFREFAYQITESGGRWGSVKRVPGITSLSAGGDSDLDVVSCKSAGHCTAGGFGESGSHRGLAFVVSRT